MSDAPPTPRSPLRAAGGEPPRTRVVFVPRPYRTVAPGPAGNGLMAALAIAAFASIGGLGLVVLSGLLGHRLGFAPLARVPDLDLDATGAIAAGTLSLARLPIVILAGAEGRLGLWLVAFLLIAVPAAGLSVARPRTAGGPGPDRLTSTFATLGAVAAGLAAVAVIGWIVGPLRTGGLVPLPADVAEVDAWAAGLDALAGLDSLALTAGVLWLLLVIRLPIDRWLKALILVAEAIAIAIAIAGWTVTIGASTSFGMPRSVGTIEAGGDRSVLRLGAVDGRPVLLESVPGVDGRTTARVTIHDEPATLTVRERSTVRAFLTAGD